MNSDLENKIMRDFPIIFGECKSQSKVKYPIQQFGIECHDGWYALIYNLSVEIEKQVKQWIEENPDEKDHHPRVIQIKEKFGGLRYYMSSATEYIYDLIEKAEVNSFSICESCGKEAHLKVYHGWRYVLCCDCYKLLEDHKLGVDDTNNVTSYE